MSTYLAFVQHDTKQNTLEATWLQEVFDVNNNLIALNSVKCRNYSQLQKTDFLNDLATYGVAVDGTKYCTMAGW